MKGLIMLDLEESKKKMECVYCEDGFYYDVLGSKCNYNYCPMCGEILSKETNEGEKQRLHNYTLANNTIGGIL